MKLTAIVATTAVVIIVGLGAMLHLERQSHQTTIKELASIQAVQATEKQRQVKNKKKADAENKRLRSDLATANQRLRDKIAGSNFTGNSGNSESVCFGRTEFDRAIRNFVEGVGRIAGKGSEAITDLNTARKWAQQN